MYALIDYKGRQFKVEKGQTIRVDRMSEEKGSTLDISKVLMVSDGEKVQVGSPYVEGAVVSTEVGDTFKDKKVVIIKFKRRKSYRRRNGHRQQYTYLKVTDIKA